MNLFSRLTRLALRLGAALIVVAVLVGPVLLMAAIAGNPLDGDVVSSLGDRQVDNATVLKLLSVGFYVLWAWFALPALRQVRQSLATPHAASPATSATSRASAVALPSDEPGPRGWLAGLVRYALTTATITVAVSAMPTGGLVATASAPTAVVVDDTAGTATVTDIGTKIDRSQSVSEVTAQRRDTPYSIARRTFPNDVDNARDEIVALNVGRPTPTGSIYSGGSFPAGMTVITPYIDVDPDDTTPAPTPVPDAPVERTGARVAPTAATYVVQANDGPWSVAEALLGDGSRHVELHSLFDGQEVAPGVFFTSDTDEIHPGWTFTLTTDAPAAPVTQATTHVVVAKESLSKIAGKYLGDQDRWPELWELNRGRTMSDGTVFDNPHLIKPKWEINLPVPAVDVTEGQGVPAPVPDVVDADPTPVNTPVVPPVLEADTVDETPAPTEQTTSWPDPSSVDREPSVSTAPEAQTQADITEAPAAPVPTVPAPTSTPASTAPVVSTPAEVGGGAAGTVETAVDGQGLGAVRDVRPVWMLGLGGSTVLATALWSLVRRRRRGVSARGAARLRDQSSSSQLVDEALRTSSDTALIEWANHEINDLVAGHGMNESGSLPVIVRIGRDSGLSVRWEPPLGVEAGANWSVDETGQHWTQPTPASLTGSYDAPAAIPGLVTIGTSNDDAVLVDLESCGSVAVHGNDASAEALVRAMVLELGAGGNLSNCHVHIVGLDVDATEHLQRVRVRSEAEAIEHLRTMRVQHDDVLGKTGRASMLEVRAASGPTGREVTVVAVRASACARLDELIEAATAQRAVALVVVGDAPCAATITIDEHKNATFDPLGVTVAAAGVGRQTAAALAVHLDRVSIALDDDTTTMPAAVESGGDGPWIEPTNLVRVLGVPSADGADDLGRHELEVLAFVAVSGGNATDDEVADGVFCGRSSRTEVWNLVSAIRASAGDLVAPIVDGGNDIALADGTMSDVEWMSRRAFRSHSLDDADAVGELIDALGLVTAVPYSAPSGFEWATSSGDLAWALSMIERTAYLLVSRAIDANMADEARIALAQVIDRVRPNEPLTRALMRLESSVGNTGGVEAAYGDLSRDLAFISDGPTPATPTSGTTMLLTQDVDTAVEAPVIELAAAELRPVRQTVRPRVVLRTFGEVRVEGAEATQQLAVAFAVAAAGKAMTGDELAKLTGYSKGSLSTRFTSTNDILERHDGSLSLRSDVWTDHRWMLECARRAAAASEVGDVHEVDEWLHTLFAEVRRIDGEAFAKTPGSDSYWDWLDDFPVDVSARSAAKSEMVEAVLIGMKVWKNANADEHIPADVVVRSACDLARLVPYAAVPEAVRPGDLRSGAESLLLAAQSVATGRSELTHVVVSTAQRMVADETIEASDELADALGL